MVLLTLNKISSAFTNAIGPSLFRTGLFLRNKLVTKPSNVSNYWIDMVFLLPYSQKLLSLAIYEESKVRVADFQRKIDGTTNTGEVLDVNGKETDVQLKATSKAISSVVCHTQQLSQIRLNVLDNVLRPAILPTDRWNPDVEEMWRYDTRLVAWLRMQFLLQKYGPYLTEAMVAFPTLRQSPQLQSTYKRRFFMDLMHRGIINLDPSRGGDGGKQTDVDLFHQLPTSDVVIKAFGMQKWTQTKNTQRIRESILPVVKKLGGSVLTQQQESSLPETQSTPKHSSSSLSSLSSQTSHLLNHAVIPPDTDLRNTSLEDVLEVVTGGFIANCGPLNALCLEANFYQLWTREYVQHLGDYLLQRSLSNSKIETTILDVGAGDGLLIQCLREYMTQKTNRKTRKSSSNVTWQAEDIPTLVATDNMSWNILIRAHVEKLSVEHALAKYTGQSGDKDDNEDMLGHKQLIVLCSWMPMGEDWTSLFRDMEVDEYILIGESDDGSCGHNWLTWGNAAFCGDEEAERMMIPPYQRDGYQRWDMDVLTPFLFSSFDCAVSKSSKTVSFRRVGANGL